MDLPIAQNLPSPPPPPPTTTTTPPPEKRKKIFYFVQSGQENDSSEGTPAKNYVLYAESEDEMQEWIKALSEEIKPMIGEDKYANGFSGGKATVGSNSTSGSSKGKGKKGKGGGGQPGVDDKALDQVRQTLCVCVCVL